MTAYQLLRRGVLHVEADEAEFLLRYIMHSRHILRDQYRIMPKPEAVRLEIEGKTSTDERPGV